MSGYLGIIDWGIGGLGVCSALKERARIPTLYFSDSGHQPYGISDKLELKNRLDNICNFLYERGAERIAIACNAANAAYPDNDKVRGIISHGVDSVKKGGWQNVGLIAGQGTVSSNVYGDMLKDSGVELHQRVAQPLSAHVEAGRLDGAELSEDLADILEPISDCDAILLACTHYPVIEKEIRKHVDAECALVDPSGNMVDWILENWEFDNCDQSDWFTTGDTNQFVKCGNRAFGVEISQITQVQQNLSILN